jgi:hypothetical protein
MPKPTSQNIQTFLDKVQKDCPNIKTLESAIIPTPKQSELKGNVLYINASYRTFESQDSPDAILQSYRNDTRLILQKLAGESFKKDFMGTCVSFYEVPDKGYQNLRVYRTNSVNRDTENIDQMEKEFIENEFSAHPRLIERYKSKLIHLKEGDENQP